LQNAYVAPSNELEQTIADIWRKLLGIEQVGLHDNFLELGGHSLLATQLLYQLREEFQVGLTLQSFFGEPTIGGLSEIILDKLVEKEESETLTQILEEIEQLSEDDVQTVRIAGK
jgi:acyl carrier protein